MVHISFVPYPALSTVKSVFRYSSDVYLESTKVIHHIGKEKPRTHRKMKPLYVAENIVSDSEEEEEMESPLDESYRLGLECDIDNLLTYESEIDAEQVILGLWYCEKTLQVRLEFFNIFLTLGVTISTLIHCERLLSTMVSNGEESNEIQRAFLAYIRLKLGSIVIAANFSRPHESSGQQVSQS